jgi:hypothetical protein
MTRIYKKLGRALLLMTVVSFVLSACYEKFDEDSYAPVFTISGFSSVKQIEPSSLVAYWGFEESLVDSVSGAAGTNKASTFVNGFKGKAVSFDVANKAYVTFDANSAITGLQSFTISFWVNPVFVDANADNGVDGILGLVNLSNVGRFWGNINIFVENNSNPDAAIVKAIITSGTQESDILVEGYKGFFGAWTNHTLTYDASTSELIYYINGSKVKSKTANWTGPIGFTDSGPMVFGTVHFQTTPSLTTGSGAQPWASYLTGTLDEVRIYNKALSAENINALVVLQGKGK